MLETFNQTFVWFMQDECTCILQLCFRLPTCTSCGAKGTLHRRNLLQCRLDEEQIQKVKIISFADFHRDNFVKRFRAYTHIHTSITSICSPLYSIYNRTWHLGFWGLRFCCAVKKATSRPFSL